MAISIGVLVYFLITTDGITAFAEIAGSIQIPWFISIFAAIIVGWLLEALVLHFFCKKVYPQWKYWHSLIIGMIGLLYSALTPFATRRSSNANLLHEKAGNGYRWGRLHYCR